MTRKEILKNVKPILFNTDMVRAILDGLKEVTRRLGSWKIAKLNVDRNGMVTATVFKETKRGKTVSHFAGGTMQEFVKEFSDYQPGDILYVRESVWQKIGHYLDVDGETKPSWYKEFKYVATDKGPETGWNYAWVKRPSIHMPKEVARIFLKVTNVRVERLQEMPHDGALKEGIHYCECPDGFTWKSNTDMHNCYITPMGAMKVLWDSTIKKSDLDRYGWDANPWVWVTEFERIEVDE